MPTPGIAAGAYASIARVTDATAGQKQSAAQKLVADGNADFGSMVNKAVSNVVETGREAESSAIDLLQGKANMVDVVTAVAETEVAMETLVSVRDRVISAYEEIMRMPI